MKRKVGEGKCQQHSMAKIAKSIYLYSCASSLRGVNVYFICTALFLLRQVPHNSSRRPLRWVCGGGGRAKLEKSLVGPSKFHFYSAPNLSFL